MSEEIKAESENKIIKKIPAGWTLDEAVYDLQEAKKKGINLHYIFNGKIDLGPGIGYDEAWNMCYGISKETLTADIEEKNKLEERIANRRQYMDQSDLARIERVKKARAKSPHGKEVIEANVISGLKYLVENRFADADTVCDALINRGCLFTINDVYDYEVKPFTREKFRDGSIAAAAYVVANMRDSKISRETFENMLFLVDDDYSVYNFIRLATGDKTYTKALADRKNIENEALAKSKIETKKKGL